MTVHNHPPYRPVCNERRVNGQLRGACLTDEGDPVSDTKPDLDAIEKRANAATPGPWHWRNSSHSVHLFGERHRVVMGFERMGMQGAQPTFRDDRNILHPAGKLNINEFPDAAFIARAREDMAALVAYARTLEAERDQLRDTLARRSAAHARLAQRLDQVRAALLQGGQTGAIRAREALRVLDGDQRTETP